MTAAAATASRDLLAWLVDVTTVVVGVAAVAALVITIFDRRAAARGSERSWSRQIALDHHARIYQAMAALIAAVGDYGRRASSRLGARGAALAEYSWGGTADETAEPEFAALLDSLGGTLASVRESHARVVEAVEYVWFLIPASGDGEQLLADLVLIRDVLRAVEPHIGHEAGTGDLLGELNSSGLRSSLELTMSTENLDEPMRRVEFVCLLITRYLTRRIGRFVPPPPLASDVT